MPIAGSGANQISRAAGEAGRPCSPAQDAPVCVNLLSIALPQLPRCLSR